MSVGIHTVGRSMLYVRIGLVTVAILYLGWALATHNAPPLAPRSISAALCAVLSAAAYFATTAHTRDGRPHTRAAITWLAAAVVLVIAYTLALNAWTVRSPRDHRYQIGFGTSAGSLTAEGERIVQEHPGIGPSEIMQGKGWSETTVEAVWTKGSVLGAGALVLALFSGTFLSWAIGTGLFLHSARKSITLSESVELASHTIH